jgi:predicted RNA-binding protein associated with RNAse of E/G family
VSVINIHYTRLPDRTSSYAQQLVYRDASCIVTLNPATELTKPVTAGDRVILEPGAPAVWFTFPALWHDIGRFHRADGTFTGFYANILTPPQLHSPTDIATTDLCLDVWLDADGELLLLDEDDLEHALRSQWVSQSDADRVRAEARAVMAAARTGTWPPAIAAHWTLAAARSSLRAQALLASRSTAS